MKSNRTSRRAPAKNQPTFRRSRTISGSASSSVRAAAEDKASLKSERTKKQARKKMRRMIGIIFVVTAVVVAGLYFLVSQYAVSADVQYQPHPSKTPPTADYGRDIKAYWAAHPGEHFRFSLSQDSLTSFLQRKYPEIQRVTLDGGSFGQAQFTIQLRKPVARWRINQKNYFVDSDGQAYLDNYYNAPDVEVIDKSGAQVGEGSPLASQGFLRFLGRLVAQVNASKLGDVASASLPPGTTREVDIRLKGKGYFIKTHTDRDPAAEVQDLQRAVAYFKNHQIQPHYIDLRVEGKAFYQ